MAPNGRMCLIILATLMVCLHPVPQSSAELAMEEDGQLNLICTSDDECSLRNDLIGESLISGRIDDATPLTPKVIDLEFMMQPSQVQMALLPELMDELSIDLRMRDDALGWFSPDLQVSLRLGGGENEWTIQGSGPGLQDQPNPYRLEDEPLNHDEGRLIMPDEIVRLALRFQVDRPVDWELHLLGSSYVDIQIPWSVLPASRDVDEPSSWESPREYDEVEIWHDGALVGDEDDCFNFDLEKHELFVMIFRWEAVPVEIQQDHHIPDFIGPDRRNVPTPDIESSSDGENLLTSYQYRGLETGLYKMCLHGGDDRFQPYSWMGRYTYEGIGSSDPDQFNGQASWNQGTTTMGSEEAAIPVEGGGVFTLAFGFLMLFGIIGSAAVDPTWRWSRRLMLPLSGILVLLGGIIHPIMMWSEAVGNEDAIEIQTLLELRLEQIWQVLAPGTPENTRAEHLGATFGLLPGERLQLEMEMTDSVPMEDGRYQLISPDLDDLRLDRLIFNHLKNVGAGHSSGGDLSTRSVDFVLLAGRALALDLLMLEALLVVEEPPSHGLLQIDWTMKPASATGSLMNPVWMTRPDGVELSDWSRLQASLFPDAISISYCDCGLEDMDLTWTPSNSLDPVDLPTTGGIETADGLGSKANWLLIIGTILILLTAFKEGGRRRKARRLAGEFMY